LFVTTVAALGLTEAWNFIQSRERSAAAVLVTLATAMICAKLIGGFFVSASYPPAEGLFQTAFYARDFSTLDAVVGQARQNLALSGLLLIPGALGLWRVRHERLFLALLAGIGFVVYNSLRYGHTDDIFKFATVSFIALAIGAGIFVSDLAHWADTPIRKLTRGALIVALLWKGVFFHFYVIWLYDPEARSPISVQMIRPYFSVEYPVDEHEARAVNFLRAHMGPSELVYRAREKSVPYGIWGGLPTQASVWPSDTEDNDPYGLGITKFAARKNLDTVSEDWLDRMAAQRVTWLVTDADDAEINDILACPEAKSRAVLTTWYGRIRIFKIG